MFGKPKIVDPYNTMGNQPARQQSSRGRSRWLPASTDDGDLSGVPLEDIARAHGYTLEAAARFRDAWNEAARYPRTRRGNRACLDMDDIDTDPKNWKDW